MPRRRPAQTLGQLLQHARQAQGWSLRHAAAQIQRTTGHPMSPQYLSNLEQNRRTPSLATLQALAAGLDLPYARLLAHAHKAEAMVRQYLRARPDCEALLIEFFLLAEQCQFAAWERLLWQLRTAHDLRTIPTLWALPAVPPCAGARTQGHPEEGTPCMPRSIDPPAS